MMKFLMLTAAMVSFMFVHGQFNCQSTKSAFTNAAITPPINNNAKSDTLDVLHYHLNLDLTAIQSGNLVGTANIKFQSKLNNVNSLNLDLINLLVDSVIYNSSTNCVFTYSGGPLLRVNLPSTANANDTFSLTVKYHGLPAVDASGWGGFHRNNPYFFNLGVGFDANPHTYGRSWFPCFDNFVERSTFSFAVKSASGRKAYCNGIRTQLDTTTFGGDTVVSYWDMTNEIPTYLASVALSNYVELEHTHQGMPFLLLARPTDTANAKSAFANLDTIYSGFVQRYGPYQWQKVGYALTTIGAMEHATSIHYPLNNLSSEDIIAHELAHHWFGNLITCQTAGDMWINEGMAEYLSHQYVEDVYDRETYMTEVVNNHSLVIQYAAIQDGGHYAISGLPNELTYGTHTYQKGAMVGHNLRGYLGDSLFFAGLKQLVQNNAFADINSTAFRDELTQITGYDLTSFFNDWVFNPGYPDFDVDSFHLHVSSLPEDIATVRVGQRMFATNKRFTNVPLQITLHDYQGNKQTFDVMFNGADTNYTFMVPFAAEWANINEADHIFTGVSGRNYTVVQQGILNDTRTKMRLTTGPITDTVRFRVEHHWTGPTTKGNENFKISKNRFWRVSGALPFDFQPTVQLEFSSFSATGNLDEDLLAFGEDSLILVYRPDPTQPWAEHPNYTKDYVGSPSNKFGRIIIHALYPGEYAFANGVSLFGVEETPIASAIQLYPNPANHTLHVDISELANIQSWQIIDAKGAELKAGEIANGTKTLQIDVTEFAAGIYFFCTPKGSLKFVVN